MTSPMRPPGSPLRLALMVALVLPIASLAIAQIGVKAQPAAIASLPEFALMPIAREG